MNRTTPRLICRICLLVLLLLAAVQAPLPYFVPAALLFVASGWDLVRSFPPRWAVLVQLGVIFLLPWFLGALLEKTAWLPYLGGSLGKAGTLGMVVAQLVVLPAMAPAFILLDYALKEQALTVKIIPARRPGRRLTGIAISLLVLGVGGILIAFITGGVSLLFSGAIILLYLTCWILYLRRAIPCQSLHIEPVEKRLLAGDIARITFSPRSRAGTPLYIKYRPMIDWVQVQEASSPGAPLTITVQPPLSGPTQPQVLATLSDRRSLFQVDQVIHPVALHVIPRAKYAEWLARRYLEQSGMLGAEEDVMPKKPNLVPHRGLEYLGSRTYQPGDEMRSIDWKHTLKLNNLIIKEYTQNTEQAAILAVNLSVSNAEEADKLAFNLITTALTLAQKDVPTALAAYNRKDVVFTTTVIEPKETLRQTLGLVKEIETVAFGEKSLRRVDIGRLRRDLYRLGQANSPVARKLAALLGFEYKALIEAAEHNPAARAVFEVTQHLSSRAVLIFISYLNHDAEALMVTADKMAHKGFTYLFMEPEGNKIARVKCITNYP
jgi:hypothetical protein